MKLVHEIVVLRTRSTVYGTSLYSMTPNIKLSTPPISPSPCNCEVAPFKSHTGTIDGPYGYFRGSERAEVK